MPTEALARRAAERVGEALELRAVSKRFGGVQAVDALDLAVAPGEAVAVIGPNGAGKSTLLKLIAGIHRPDAAMRSMRSTAVGEHSASHRPPSLPKHFWGAK